ncbi:MAG: DMT family transporter [Acidimicrobiia bacterium]
MTPRVLVLVVLSIGLIGSADFFGGIASKRSSPFTVAALSQWVGVPVITVVALLEGGAMIARDAQLGLLAGVGSALGVVVMYRGFSVASVGVVAPIASTVGAMLPIVVGLATGERPSALVATGLVFGVASVLLVGYVRGQARLSIRGVAHGIVAGSGFAAMVVIYAATSEASGLTAAVSGRISAATLATLAMVAVGAPRRVSRTAVKPAVLSGVFAGVGMGFFVSASQVGELVVVGVAVAMFPVVTVILAALFLDERLVRSQWAGVALAASAVAMISVG